MELVPRCIELVGVAAKEPSVLNDPNAVSFVGVVEVVPGMTLVHIPV